MTTGAAIAPPANRVLDRAVFAAALAHGVGAAALLAVARACGPMGRALIAIVLGVAMNWCANTVSHIHLHRPLFKGQSANRLFSAYLSVLLAVPQRWWKLRHLRHHGLVEGGGPIRLGAAGTAEIVLVIAIFALLASTAPSLLGVVVPALVVGFGLCALQGHAEHASAAAGVDYRGRVYNLLWFNDGFHAAHHRAPSSGWRDLPGDRRSDDTVSRLPPALRWTESLPVLCNHVCAGALDWLERGTRDVDFIRRRLLRAHATAFATLLSPAERAQIQTVTVVGGGLFPRTVLVLGPLLPAARFTIIDRDAGHVAAARNEIAASELAPRVTFEVGAFDVARLGTCDLLVLPLAFRGVRRRFYAHPPARLVAIHDWGWRTGAARRGVRVATLPKRINLVVDSAA